MVVWDLVVGLSTVDVQVAEILSDEQFLMGFEESVETTFGEAKCAEEKEVDISRHLGFGVC